MYPNRYANQPCDRSLTSIVKDLEGREFFVKEIWVPPGQFEWDGVSRKDLSEEEFIKLTRSGGRQMFVGEAADTGLPCSAFTIEWLNARTFRPLS